MTPAPTPTSHKFFIAAATIGIVGWLCVLMLLGFWYLAPVALPTVTQPLPILNPGHQIAIGDPIVVELDVIKTAPTDVQSSSRFLACESGNLVTLTGMPTNLPVGEYVIVSDNVILPAKVSAGEVCTMNYHIVYRINPVRTETLNLTSEPFTVTKG
jgi:hypothetical protein